MLLLTTRYTIDLRGAGTLAEPLVPADVGSSQGFQSGRLSEVAEETGNGQIMPRSTTLKCIPYLVATTARTLAVSALLGCDAESGAGQWKTFYWHYAEKSSWPSNERPPGSGGALECFVYVRLQTTRTLHYLAYGCMHQRRLALGHL